MSKRSRGHRPPAQSYGIRPQDLNGAVDLKQKMQTEEDQRKVQEAAMRQQVLGLAAGLFCQFVDPDAPDIEVEAGERARQAVEAALVFARDVWGFMISRVNPATVEEGADMPQPIED